MADVTLPLVGPVSKKWLVIVAVGSAGSLAWFAWRRRQNTAAAASTTAATDTTGTGQIDPLTGDIAGSAQDQMDLAALQDESGAYGTDGFGNYGGYLAATPAAASIPGAGGFTTNGEWAQQAETDLGGIGVDETALAAALGNYLTGKPLSSSQQSLVDQAIAEEGYPPVSGAGGYPPAMKTSATGSGSGTGGTKGVSLDQPHAITHAQADTLLGEGGDVYYKATDGSYVAVHKTAGTGQLYTGARGWARLHQPAKGK